jgi:hypothetical protein
MTATHDLKTSKSVREKKKANERESVFIIYGFYALFSLFSKV